MKTIKILFVLIVLFISISAVSAEGNFTALQDDIDSSTDSIDINQDYVYDNSSDYKLNSGILINKSDFTINGNGYSIDGSNQARIFDIAGNNITISNLIFINGNISGNLGGALHSSGSITLNNVTFKYNSANCGGAISVSGQCIINNAIFTNNTAPEDGGAIIAWDKLTINNATFTSNTASTSGGAIYVIGETTINNTVFANNQADFGGAVNTWTKTIINNSTFKNNKGEYGGAIYAAGKTTIKNVKFSNNTATQNGGALNARDETSIDTAIFADNVAAASGGAIFANGNSDLINCVFENNSAKNGGAVYFNGGIKNNQINSTFNGNSAIRAGGAIFVRETAINNTITSEFSSNVAREASGGGIFFYKTAENNNIESVFTNNIAAYGAGMFFYSESNNNTFKGDFINNTALSCGGAMFFYSKTNYNTFKGKFINNSAHGLIDEINGNGGAITFKNTSKNCEFDCDFINNTARLFGGAVNYRMTPYNITFNGNFISNSAESGGGLNFFDEFENVSFNCNFIANNATIGGGIAINKENAISNRIPAVANCNFTSNNATRGGAIYFKGNGIVKDCNFAYNHAESGGAIFANGNSDLINCVFENNSAKNGGAVYFNGGIKNNQINSTFNGNSAIRAGGAIFVRETAINNTITSEFSSNVAREASGGGIFFYKTAENNNIESVFTNNIAAYGAGMFFYSESNNNTFKGDFINNTALSCGGAMFFYSKTNYNTFKGKFINNSAHGLIDEINGNGGAITFKNTSKNCEFDCDFINNTARLFGGAVNYRMTPYNITFNGNFISNSAESGGGLNFFDEFENVSFNCNFIANNATIGGGIAINKENAISNRIPAVANCNFTSNNATRGGAIYFKGNGIVKDCNFAYNHAERGGAILASELYCENSNFENNTATMGGAMDIGSINIKNNTFNANSAEFGASIKFLDNAKIEDTKFLNSHDCTYSMIYGTGYGSILINNCEFLNLTSKYAPAMYISNKNKVTVKNSTFKDLHALLSSGAIAMKIIQDQIEIENCVFINTTAVNNGGALYLDMDDDMVESDVNTIVKNNTFINCSANFGGAIVQLGGNMEINDSRFLENGAEYDGGAIYVSFVNLKLDNTKIISNRLLYEELFDGGGIYCEKSNVSISNSLLERNTKNAIYSYGCKLSIENTAFSENTESIHAVFTTSTLKDNDYGNDTLVLNDTYYTTVIKESGMKIQLINNTINVENLPLRYDSRDWGWISSVKDQGDMGACWTFGNCGALESTLLKATGIEYDLSENNMQNSMLKYSKYGVVFSCEGGTYIQGVEYAISWVGVFPSTYDTYDEIGKISPLISAGEKIHIQDVIFIEPRRNATDNDALKRAIIECGSVTLNYLNVETEPYYNEKTHAQYQNISSTPKHSVSVVGWDDNYPASNFLITPPGDGAFIIKNSYDESFGENGFMYISYYDTSILNETTWGNLTESTSVGYVLKNQESYNKIYQRDVGGLINKSNSYTAFKVKYQSTGNDLISGIGSYFRENEEYVIEIYINDELKYTQTGNAPFTGYHTVRLTSEIPIKDSDNFMVLMKKDYVPIIYNSTQFYESGSVFVEMNGQWVDMALENKSATLKVYTKDLAIYTEDLVKIYKNDSQFEAEIGACNETVTFEINGGTYYRTSNENGTAKIAINLNPGNYTIKTTFNGTTVENTITVLPTLIADNLVKYFRNASQFYISLIDGKGNLVAGVNITMNINGVFYNRLTNENGTARLNINLNPGEYILTAIDPLTGLMMSYNITVLSTLEADDLEMKYKDGSTFNVTVLDGQGKPAYKAAVTFNINGVFYTRYTDSSGIAKLNINLMAGEYIITSEYDELRISNTITIKD